MTGAKIGRNVPCPCGSGKKYKKCHMGKIGYEQLRALNHSDIRKLDAETESREFDQDFLGSIRATVKEDVTLDLLVQVGAISTLPQNQRFTMRFNYLIEALCSQPAAKETQEPNSKTVRNLIRLINNTVGPRIRWAEVDTENQTFLSEYWFEKRHYYLFPGGLEMPDAYLYQILFVGEVFKDEINNCLGFDHVDVLNLLLPLVDSYIRETELIQYEFTASGDFGRNAVIGEPDTVERLCHSFRKHFVFGKHALEEKQQRILNALSKRIGTYVPAISNAIHNSGLDIHPVVKINEKFVIPLPQILWFGIANLFTSVIRSLDDKNAVENRFWHATLTRVYVSLVRAFGEENVLPEPSYDGKRLAQIAVHFDKDKLFQFIVVSRARDVQLQLLVDQSLEEAITTWKQFVEEGEGVIATSFGYKKIEDPSKVEPIRIVLVNSASFSAIAGFPRSLWEEGIIQEIMTVHELEYILHDVESPMQFLKFLRNQDRFFKQAQRIVRLSVLDSYGLYKSSRAITVEAGEEEPSLIFIHPHSLDLSESERRDRAKRKQEELIVRCSDGDYILNKLGDRYYAGVLPYTLDALILVQGDPQTYMFLERTIEHTDYSFRSILIAAESLAHHLSEAPEILRAIKNNFPNIDKLELRLSSTLADEKADQTSVTFEEISLKDKELRLNMLVGSQVIYRFAPPKNEGERYVLQQFLEWFGLLDILDSILPPSYEKGFQIRELQVPKVFELRTDFVRVYPEDSDWVQELETEILRNNNAQEGRFKGKDAQELMIPVHDNLLRELKKRLKLYNIQDLSEVIYYQVEQLYIYKEKEEAAMAVKSETIRDVDMRIEISRMEREISQYLSAYKYLLEASIKISPAGKNIFTNEALTELLALAQRISIIDYQLEWMNYEIFPIELRITSGGRAYFMGPPEETIQSIDLDRGQITIRSQLRTLKEYELASRSGDEIGAPQEIQRYVVSADQAFKEELGYSLSERVQLQLAMLEWFDSVDDCLRVVDRDELAAELLEATELPAQTIEFFLQDIELSGEVMKGIPWLKMWPAEYFKKDQRLLNRPLVQIVLNGRTICIYGYQTTVSAWMVFFGELFSTHRLKLKRMRDNGPISQLLEIWQGEAAGEFRDEIKGICEEHNLQASVEKHNAGAIQMPKKGLGPIDVFAVDRKRKRFLAIEAKNVGLRISPKEIATERDLFLGKSPGDPKGYVQKLSRKLEWFMNNEQALKQEYDIKRDETWNFEGMIITSNLLVTQHLAKSGMPILYVDHFEDMLSEK